MKNYKFLFILAASAAVLSSCGKTVVKGKFESAPAEKQVLVKTVEGSSLRVLDTLKVSEDGSFSYKADIAKGQPEFIYFYAGDTKVASLLLSNGEKVSVECDTLGNWSVEGSDESEKLRRVEQEMASFMSQGDITARAFVDYYRSRVRYVMENSHSLTVVPVLFSAVGDTPVFFQTSDGLIFSNIADSLQTVYPNSRYVKLLRNEADLRRRQIEMNTFLEMAGQATYIDLNFDGIEGKPVLLSENLGEKATLLLFWTVTDTGNKMFIKEVLENVYEKYAPKGLQIYAVSEGGDKASWATVVKEQNTPWVNVCDLYGRGLNAYGVAELPTAFLIYGENTKKLEDLSQKALEKEIAAALR